MYYVIQKKHNDYYKHFLAYKVPSFKTSKSSENVIFEFKMSDGTMKRKWANKNDIILMTDNEEFFKLMYKRLNTMEDKHNEDIKEQQEKVSAAIGNFKEDMDEEFDNFMKKKLREDIPCALKKFL